MLVEASIIQMALNIQDEPTPIVSVGSENSIACCYCGKEKQSGGYYCNTDIN